MNLIMKDAHAHHVENIYMNHIIDESRSTVVGWSHLIQTEDKKKH